MTLGLAPGYAGPVTRFTVYTHVDQRRQRSYIAHHPFRFLRTIGRTLSTYWTDFLHQTVAQVPLWAVPVAIVVAAFAIVAVAATVPERAAEGQAGTSRSVLGVRSRALLVGIAGATFFALMVLAYLGWNAFEAPRIDAFQGRYLLPLLPLLFLALPARRATTADGSRNVAIITVAAASPLLLTVVFIGLRSHFY